MKIEVKSVATTKKSGVAKATGKPFEITEQEGWIDFPSGERRRVKIALEDGANPYPIGAYGLSDESFFVNGFGGLEIGRLRLQAVGK